MSDIRSTPARRFYVRLCRSPKSPQSGYASRMTVDAWDEAGDWFDGYMEIPQERSHPKRRL